MYSDLDNGHGTVKALKVNVNNVVIKPNFQLDQKEL